MFLLIILYVFSMRFHSYLSLSAVFPSADNSQIYATTQASLQTDRPNTYLASLQISQNQPSKICAHFHSKPPPALLSLARLDGTTTHSTVQSRNLGLFLSSSILLISPPPKCPINYEFPAILPLKYISQLCLLSSSPISILVYSTIHCPHHGQSGFDLYLFLFLIKKLTMPLSA